MADDTSKLKPRPEFGEGVFEGPPGPGGARATAEPEPGTPEFGIRAEARARSQSPTAVTARAGLTPTPEELASVEAATETPDPPVAVSSGQPGAQLGNTDALLKMFDVPAPVIGTLLDDPTPVNEGAPEDDIIARLAESILGDQTEIPQARGFTPGEHLALGIMGALDGEMFQSVVLPLLMNERNAPRQAALDMEAQKQHRMAAMQALATLMSSRREHEASLAMQERGQRIDIAQRNQQMAFQAAQANASRRLQIMLAQMREKSRQAAKSKVGDRVFGTYMLSVTAFQDAMRMKKLLDNNPNLGGFIEGSQTAAMLNLRPKDTAEFAALGGTVNEAIMMITQRRGLNKESMKKIGDSLADVKQGSNTLRAAVQTAIRTFGQQIAGDEVAHPQLSNSKKAMLQLIDKSQSDPEAINEMIRDPESWARTNGFDEQMYSGHENGDVDLGLFRDDSEVP